MRRINGARAGTGEARTGSTGRGRPAHAKTGVGAVSVDAAGAGVEARGVPSSGAQQDVVAGTIPAGAQHSCEATEAAAVGGGTHGQTMASRQARLARVASRPRRE